MTTIVKRAGDRRQFGLLEGWRRRIGARSLVGAGLATTNWARGPAVSSAVHNGGRYGGSDVDSATFRPLLLRCLLSPPFLRQCARVMRQTALAILSVAMGCFVGHSPSKPTSSSSVAEAAAGRGAAKPEPAVQSSPRVYAGRSFEAPAPRGFGKRMLGRAYNGKFVLLRGAEPLFPPETTPDGGAEARGTFEVLEEGGRLNASLSAWGVGVTGSTETKRTYAVYRAQEIIRCEALVEDGGLPLDLPSRARWYPARVCYGRQFELVFSTEEEVDKVALEADWLAWSASAEAFASKHQLKLVFGSRGFKRGENCKKLLFTTPEAFEDCFGGLEESASVPISVEWVELPAQVKRRRQQKRASAKAKRQPCLKWRFTKATYDPPEGGLEIRMTFRWPNGARRVFRGMSVDLVGLPAVRSGSKIGYFIEDVDLVFDDKLASGTLEVPSRLDDGSLMAEGLTLHGRCEQRKKPPRRKSPRTR